MKNKKKYSLLMLSLCLLLIGNTGTAQEHRQEFSLTGGAGFSGFMYTPQQGSLKNGFGGKFGLGYTYFFTPSWGLHTGVELAFYNRMATAAHLVDSTLEIYTSVGGPRDEYFKYVYTNYKEKQRATYLQIPIMAQYQHPAFKNHHWYAAAGVKLGFELTGRYNANSDQLATSAYFPSLASVIDNWPEEGIGFYKPNPKGNLDFKFNTALALEGGVKWRLSDNWSLYSGLYFDYGLFNVAPKHNDVPLVDYQPHNPPVHGYNSLLNSTRQMDQTVYNNSIHTLAAGVNIRITFGTGKIERRTKKQPVQDDYFEPVKQPLVDADVRAEQQRIEEEQATLRLAEERALREAEEKRREEEKQRQADMDSLNNFTINNYKCGVTDLNDAQENILNQKIGLLLKYPNIRLTIEGHTCDIGSDAVNMRYGMRRAEEMKAQLMSEGITEDRITTVSYGERRPVVPNTSEANRRLNRRVVVVIHKDE